MSDGGEFYGFKPGPTTIIDHNYAQDREIERLRARLAEAISKRKEAEQSAYAGAARLAEAEALLRDIRANSNHWQYIDDRIDAFLETQTSDDGHAPSCNYIVGRGCDCKEEQPAGQQPEGINTDENSDWRERELP